MLLSLLLKGSWQDGTDGTLIMVWRTSYLKWWRGALACFTCSIAASYGGFWSLSQLHHIYSATFYHASCQAGQAARPQKLRTKVISVGYVNLYKNMVQKQGWTGHMWARAAALNPPWTTLQMSTNTKKSCCLRVSHFRRHLSSRLTCDTECCSFLADCCSLLLDFLPVLALKMHSCIWFWLLSVLLWHQ